MTEVDLLDLLRSTTESTATFFGQAITITFAMVVAVYYFLNKSRLALKAFAFFVYLIGMALYLALMIQQSTLHLAALNALRALPQESLSGPSQAYILMTRSWLSLTSALLINGAFHLLWIGVAYLLFFWKKDAHEAAATTSVKVTVP